MHEKDFRMQDSALNPKPETASRRFWVQGPGRIQGFKGLGVASYKGKGRRI